MIKKHHDKKFIFDFNQRIISNLNHDLDLEQFLLFKKMLINIKNKNHSVFLIGNGGSASIASHISIDLNKLNKIQTRTFNDPSWITCLSNDYGHKFWVSKALELSVKKNDLIILISSSGKSENMIEAAKFAHKNKNKIVTFTGFNGVNKLSKLGNLNFIVDSKSYNIIENIHQIWLTMMIDLIYGSREYVAKI
jgi:D-sedoheptulose 7-phosphate isomerase